MYGGEGMMRSGFMLLHAEHTSHGFLADFLSEKLGGFGEFLDEVILHGFIDTLKLVPFLFLTYLLMEFIATDDRAADYRGLDWSQEYDYAINGDPTDTQSAL